MLKSFEMSSFREQFGRSQSGGGDDVLDYDDSAFFVFACGIIVITALLTVAFIVRQLCTSP